MVPCIYGDVCSDLADGCSFKIGHVFNLTSINITNPISKNFYLLSLTMIWLVYVTQLFLFSSITLFVTSLAKEVMSLVALVSLSVCLFVCLSVDNITQKIMNGLG